jgi:hypothetical protein
MGRGLGLFVIGLVFGGGLGFTLAAGYGVTFDGHDHSDPAAHGAADQDAGAHAMVHDTPLDVSAVDAPEVSLMLSEDPVAGYNLEIKTRNFEFAPKETGAAPVPGRGHAHVYVNGEKIARVYGPWLHIPALPTGEAVVEVTLNANDHRSLAVAGVPIAASTRMIVE